MSKSTKTNQSKKVNIDEDVYWHSGFFVALQMELIDYIDILQFIDEHELSKEALKIDVLIILKKKDVKIEKNIGRIFREHNIVEFKSETDYVSINDYYKIHAYACFYKSFNSIGLDKVSITFVEYKVPKKLFKHLKEERGFTITQPFDNIYYIKGDLFPVQIVVINTSLPESEHIFIRNLRSNLSPSDMYDVLRASEKVGYSDRRLKYIDVLMQANSNIMEEVISVLAIDKSESYRILAKAFENIYKEKGLLPEYLQIILNDKDAEMQNILIEQAKEMIKDGLPLDVVIKYSRLPKEKVESLAKISGNG